jgi:putative endonuclease
MRGERGEEIACELLRARGYRIVARNWRTRSGEIDIIARDGDVLVFVEVKARSGSGFGGPRAAVDRRKQHRIVSAARAFASEMDCTLPMRFDVVTVQPSRVRLLRDAFQVSS